MKIAFFSSEVFPFAKTGGLADIAGALPKELGKTAEDVKIIMPWYKDIEPESCGEQFGRSCITDNVEVIFIKHKEYFFRDHLYNTEKGDYSDNTERFSFFCRRSLQLLKELKFSPDILHCNDWQTAFVPVYIKTLFRGDEFFKKSKTVLTIHNLAFQGYFDKDDFKALEIKRHFKAIFLIYSRFNTLKAGIITADCITTVSPTYSKEIQNKEHGCGLGHILRKYSFKLSGVLNAIDYEVWNPEKDKVIYKNYSAGSLKFKNSNKFELKKQIGLISQKKKIMFGMVTRLTEQKGMDVLCKALPALLDKFEFVILGKGQPYYHNLLLKLQDKYPDSLKVCLRFDEKMAHHIYAGSDVLVIPSRFEPCGLSQLIGFKYGTIPLVYPTGGLKDTVKDFSASEEEGTGFTMGNYSADSLIQAIFRVSEIYDDRAKWMSLQKKVMGYDYSWRRSALKYVKLYKEQDRV